MTEYVLALDLGSSGVRAAVVSDTWSVVGEARLPFRGRSREEVLDCLGTAVREAGVPSHSIAHIAVTAQRGGIAFADGHGKTWMMSANADPLPVFQGAAIDERLGAEVYAATGHLPSMFLAPAKLHASREEHPRFSQRFATVASWGSWAAQHLSGVFAETASTLVESGLADVTTGKPAATLLAELDIALDLLPEVVIEGAVVGHLTQDAAEATGLAVGTPVALAGPDTQVATLGAGAIAPGNTVVVAGWSGPVQRVTGAPRFDDERRTWIGRHAVDGRWVAEANPGDTGRTLESVRKMLDPAMSLSKFDSNAMKAREGVEERLPIIAAWGPRALDMSNLGMSFGGLIAPSPMTYEGVAAHAVAFATIENIAFAIRECVALVNEVTGHADGPLRLVGGMANSKYFPLMLAEAIGQPVLHGSPHATAIGAALVSTLAAGDLLAAADEVGKRAALVGPDDARVAGATERYERWLHVRRTLDQLAEEL